MLAYTPKPKSTTSSSNRGRVCRCSERSHRAAAGGFGVGFPLLGRFRAASGAHSAPRAGKSAHFQLRPRLELDIVDFGSVSGPDRLPILFNKAGASALSMLGGFGSRSRPLNRPRSTIQGSNRNLDCKYSEPSHGLPTRLSGNQIFSFVVPVSADFGRQASGPRAYPKRLGKARASWDRLEVPPRKAYD